jgi:hypothetical protein
MNNMKLITCISPIKKGLEFLALLHDKGIDSASRSTAKGSSSNTFEVTEMEIIEVLIEENDSNEIFELMYDFFQIDTPHHGILFQKSIKRASTYILPKSHEIKDEHQ